jgi:energy-coupling factor transporter ATP-binding protein EcfA2
VAAEPFCPYVGLQPYTEAHQKYFFGREREQRIIANNVYAAKLTVLLGPSGSGKSSLLQAGVVPHLRAGRQTAVVVFRKWQSEQYMEDLKTECLRAVSAAHGSPINVDVGLPLDDLLFAACQISGRTILLLFDQSISGRMQPIRRLILNLPARSIAKKST